MNTVLQARPRNFVSTPTLERTAFRALRYLKSGYSVHLKGPAGTGKTTLALHLADLLGRPIMLLFGDDEFKTSDLIGSQSGYTRKKVVDNYIHSVMKVEDELRHNWIDSRLTLACREGFTLVYDEFNRSRPEVNNVLLSALEEKLLVLPPHQNRSEYIRVSPHFRAIFTSNPEEYCGVHGTQDALQDRLITINMPEPDELAQQQILTQKVGLDSLAALQIVRLVKAFQADAAPDMVSSLRPSLMIATICNDHGIIPLAENSDFRDVCSDVLLDRSKHPLPEATRRLWDLFNQFVGTQVGLAEQLKGSYDAQRSVARLHGEENDGEGLSINRVAPIVADDGPRWEAVTQAGELTPEAVSLDTAVLGEEDAGSPVLGEGGWDVSGAVAIEEVPDREGASLGEDGLEASGPERMTGLDLPNPGEPHDDDLAFVASVLEEPAPVEEPLGLAEPPLDLGVSLDLPNLGQELALEDPGPAQAEVSTAEIRGFEERDLDPISLEPPAFGVSTEDEGGILNPVPEADVLEDLVSETAEVGEGILGVSAPVDSLASDVSAGLEGAVLGVSETDAPAFDKSPIFDMDPDFGASIPEEDAFLEDVVPDDPFPDVDLYLEEPRQEGPDLGVEGWLETPIQSVAAPVDDPCLGGAYPLGEDGREQTVGGEAVSSSVIPDAGEPIPEIITEDVPGAIPTPDLIHPACEPSPSPSALGAFVPAMVDSPAWAEPLPLPMDSGIEARIFDFLDTVGSASFSRIEVDLGLTRFQVVNALKSMLDKNLIEKGADGQRPSVYQIRPEYQELL